MYSDDYEYRDTRRPNRFSQQRQPEDTLYSVRMQCGVQTVTVALKSNHRGPFSRITVEYGNGAFASIIISATQMEDFQQCIDKVVKEDTKGMLETSGRILFARIENGDLVLGEKRSWRDDTIVIPKDGIPEFQGLFAEAIKSWKSSAIRQGKTYLDENTLYSEQIPAGRKTIQVMLKENSIGRFVRLVESDGLRYTSVMIPAQNLSDFRYHLNEAIRISGEPPTQGLPATAP